MLAGGIRRAILDCSCLALAGASACSFNASGNSRGVGVLQAADDDDGDDDAEDSSPEPQPEPEPEPGDDGDVDATRTDDGSASADDRGDDSGGTDGGEDSSVLETGAHDDGETSGGAVDEAGGTEDGGANEGTDDGSANMCPTEVFELHWAGAADLGDPMQLSIAEDAAQDPQVAVSAVAEAGTVTFPLHFDCAGEYAIWGLVWDYYPGAYATEDPDSYYVGVGGPEPTWRYGCQTAYDDSGLSWQRLESLDDQPCDTTPLVIAVAGEGDIELTFRNREAGASSEVAGIAAIVISNDPDADPYELYAPY